MPKVASDKQNAASIKQEIAINALMRGASVSAAAQEAGYSRETLSRLLHDNVVFQAELNKRRVEAQDIITGKLSGLIERVIEAVGGAFDNADLPPVVVLQSGLSVLPKLYAMLDARKIGSVNSVTLANGKSNYIASLWGSDETEINNVLQSAYKELEIVNKEPQEALR